MNCENIQRMSGAQVVYLLISLDELCRIHLDKLSLIFGDAHYGMGAVEDIWLESSSKS